MVAPELTLNELPAASDPPEPSVDGVAAVPGRADAASAVEGEGGADEANEAAA